jgi:hypothetical protein
VSGVLQCLKIHFSVSLDHLHHIVLLVKDSHRMCGMLLQGKKVDAARGLAYLLNANLTLSGGCPNPPLDPSFAQQVWLVSA